MILVVFNKVKPLKINIFFGRRNSFIKTSPCICVFHLSLHNVNFLDFVIILSKGLNYRMFFSQSKHACFLFVDSVIDDLRLPVPKRTVASVKHCDFSSFSISTVVECSSTFLHRLFVHLSLQKC